MTAPRPETAATATPPVHQSTVVRADLARTFDVVVREIGVWWPVEPFSCGVERVRDVTIEHRLGGRVVETWDDGTTRVWGELVRWNPPHGFTMSWLLTPEPTEVELTFSRLGAALTRVSVEHRGWERLTEEQLGGACALPEGYRGGSYTRGWGIILDRLAAHAQDGVR